MLRAVPDGDVAVGAVREPLEGEPEVRPTVSLAQAHVLRASARSDRGRVPLTWT